MNNYNITNIKDLPQLEQILEGNFLVVENTTGTNKLDFGDFVVGPNNTSFYSAISNDILSLSSFNISQNTSLSSLSSSIKVIKATETKSLTAIEDLTTQLYSLCTIVEKYQDSYTKRGVFNLPAGVDAYGFDVTFDYPVNVTNPDVIIVPYVSNRLLQPPGYTYVYGITGKTYLSDSTTIRIALSTGNININNNRSFEYKINAYTYP
jgi:hypothetical protein